MRAALAGALLGLSLLAGASPAAAQADGDAPASTIDDCLACHADASLTRASGTSVAVSGDGFSASVHGQLGMECTSCHADLAAAELPHDVPLAPPVCAPCHDEATADYETSVHASARAAGRTAAATCASCHTAHEIRPASDPASATHIFNLPGTCGACHSGTIPIGQAHETASDVTGAYLDSIHGRALEEKGLVVAPSCVSCHGSHAILPAAHPESRVARRNQPGTCGGCHAGIEARYVRGRHGGQLQAEDSSAPVCSDCHTAHEIRTTADQAWQVAVIEECGTCHVSFITSYRETFHGKVTALGFTRVATCASCHGAHDVLQVSDSASPVNRANRVATCQQCHEGASANFASIDPHPDRHNFARDPVLYSAGLFMDVLLGGVFIFFGVHTSLWFFRSWRSLREPGGRSGPGGGPADAGPAPPAPPREPS